MGAISSSNGHVPQNCEGVKFRPGEIIGVYKILSLIGKGGAGEVYTVEHTLTKRIEAIKALSADRAQEAQRFLREVQIHASLSHPNIASVHNAFWAGEDLIMAMELVEGQSLRAILERGRIPLATAIDWVCQALSALDYAHARQVTHRDIKPGNMLVTSKGTIKLTDFGLAKLPTDLRLTKTGMMVGSLYYMSPEQVRAVPDVDSRSDLYSVGAVLYEMVTGAKPFDGDSSFAIMLAQVGEDPRAPISLEPALPPGLNEVILKALAKDPCDRFQSALEFRLAVESFRESESAARVSTEDCPSAEGILDKPSSQAELNSVLKRIQKLAKKVTTDFFRLPKSANSWNWAFHLSTTREQLGRVLQPVDRVSRPLTQIEPDEVLPAVIPWQPSGKIRAWIPKWRSFAVAASLLAVCGSVYATRTWQRIRLTPPMSSSAIAQLRGPQQMTTPVAGLGAVAVHTGLLQPLNATLTLHMSAGNAALNDNPVPMQDGSATQNLAIGDHSLQLIRNGGKAIIEFQIRAGALPEVTNFNSRNIAITAVALFGKEAHLYRSGKSNDIRIADLSPGLRTIDTGDGADKVQVRVGDAPSLQVFVTDPKTVDLMVASKEKAPLASGKPQTIQFALVPTVANVSLIDTPATERSIDKAGTGTVSSTVLDVSSGTEQNLQPGETITASGNGYGDTDAPGSETVATASFEPIGPSRLHKVLDRVSPARVVHPHEKVGFVPAKPIHTATASAPLRLMRGARGQVSANIRVTIDKHGKVTGVNLDPAAVRGPLPSAAMAAAWNWTFTPARKGVNPVESQAILHFRFENPEFASANR
jgi:serine/threonine protein kinase